MNSIAAIALILLTRSEQPESAGGKSGDLQTGLAHARDACGLRGTLDQLVTPYGATLMQNLARCYFMAGDDRSGTVEKLKKTISQMDGISVWDDWNQWSIVLGFVSLQSPEKRQEIHRGCSSDILTSIKTLGRSVMLCVSSTRKQQNIWRYSATSVVSRMVLTCFGNQRKQWDFQYWFPHISTDFPIPNRAVEKNPLHALFASRSALQQLEAWPGI